MGGPVLAATAETQGPFTGLKAVAVEANVDRPDFGINRVFTLSTACALVPLALALSTNSLLVAFDFLDTTEELGVERVEGVCTETRISSASRFAFSCFQNGSRIKASKPEADRYPRQRLPCFRSSRAHCGFVWLPRPERRVFGSNMSHSESACLSLPKLWNPSS